MYTHPGMSLLYIYVQPGISYKLIFDLPWCTLYINLCLLEFSYDYLFLLNAISLIIATFFAWTEIAISDYCDIICVISNHNYRDIYSYCSYDKSRHRKRDTSRLGEKGKETEKKRQKGETVD
jgi:hypothetical protein